MKITSQNAAVQQTIRIIADKMLAATMDEIVEHKTLRALIPKDVGKWAPYYNIISRARLLLNKEHGAVFATVFGAGYRRLPHGVGAQHTTKITFEAVRRRTKKGVAFTNNALRQANDLTAVERRDIYQDLNRLSMIDYWTRRKSRRALPDPPKDVEQ